MLFKELANDEREVAHGWNNLFRVWDTTSPRTQRWSSSIVLSVFVRMGLDKEEQYYSCWLPASNLSYNSSEEYSSLGHAQQESRKLVWVLAVRSSEPAGSLQLGGILTMEEGRHMIRQSDDERAKAERLLKRLEERDSKMRKKVGRCRC